MKSVKFMARGLVTERIFSLVFINIEYFERKKLILNHFVKIIVACPHFLPKLPESTQRKHTIPNKGSLFYSHCDLDSLSCKIGCRLVDCGFVESGFCYSSSQKVLEPHLEAVARPF
jgi:hypothetical protein